QIFDQVFGTAGAARVRPVLGGQADWDGFQTYELQFIQQQFGAPSNYIYAQAVAPYVSSDNDISTPGLTLDQVFAGLNHHLTNYTIPLIQADAALDKQYNVPMIAYEGGQSLVPWPNNPNFAVLQQAQTDPRMYLLYARLMQAWQQVGGGLFDALA